MTYQTKLLVAALCPILLAQTGQGATAELTKSGSNFIVKVDGVQTLSTTNYAEALQNAAGTGNRVMNIRASGNWDTEVRMRATSSFNYLTSTYSYARTPAGKAAIWAYKSGGIQIAGLKLNGYPSYGLHISSCASPSITNTDVDCRDTSQPVVAIRVDSEGSTRTTGLYARNVNVRNMTSGDRQGFETYSIDGYDLDGMWASNLGGCGVLINDGRNGKIGTATSGYCGKGTTYAGLRWANNCATATASRGNSNDSSRGIFILNATGITVNTATIVNCPVDSIWIQNGSNNRIASGTVKGGRSPVITSSPGSSINVTYTP
jgi:hypothetical protein